jgi:hypothetical protein
MKYLLLIGVLSLIALHAAAQSNQVYFPYFELISLDKSGELQYSTSRLAKTYIESNHNMHVVLPDHDGMTYAEKQSINISMQHAQSANLPLVMTGEIHNLNGSFIVALAVYDAKTGEKKWSDMLKGASTEDIDLLLARLGRTFMSSTKARNDIEIDEVTSYEQRGVELQQIKANHYFGVMVGGNVLVGNRTLSGFGLNYTFDASTVLFNVNLDFFFGAEESDEPAVDKQEKQLSSFNMGVIYPLSRKRMTWFLQGGMDYSGVYMEQVDGYISTGGVGLLVGGGYLLNRNSTVNLRIHSALHFPTYQVDGNYYPSFRFGLTTSISK